MAARAEIAGGGVEFAAPPVGFAAPQVGQHRVGPQGDRAAVGLDRGEGLVVGERRVAAGEELPVVALAGGRLVDDDAADHGGGAGRP